MVAVEGISAQPVFADVNVRSPGVAALPMLKAEIAAGNSAFPPGVLAFGFVKGVVLAVACLALSAWYLIAFERQTTAIVSNVLAGAHDVSSPQEITITELGLNVHAYVARILLLSCGIFVGMAFGFLGFSLFLMGVQGDIAASARGPNEMSFSVARLSPGIFAILCAAILVGICATHAVDFGITLGTSVEKPVAAGTEPINPATEKADHRMPGGK